MKVESNLKPKNKFEIENIVGNTCDVILYDKIKKITYTETDEEGQEIEKVKYEYEMYRLKNTVYRSQLAESLKETATLKKWLEYAVEIEYNERASEIRKRRDELLNATDWTQMADTALSEQKQEAYRIYRQALRDVPEQEGFPYDVEFPVLEEG